VSSRRFQFADGDGYWFIREPSTDPPAESEAQAPATPCRRCSNIAGSKRWSFGGKSLSGWQEYPRTALRFRVFIGAGNVRAYQEGIRLYFHASARETMSSAGTQSGLRGSPTHVIPTRGGVPVCNGRWLPSKSGKVPKVISRVVSLWESPGVSVRDMQLHIKQYCE
jgi:hypothetical protein